MGKHRGQHERKLIASTADDVLLAVLVEERFLAVCDLYLRERGQELQIPPDVRPDLLRWREMRNRFKCCRCGGRALAHKPDGQLIVDRADLLPCCGRCGGRGDYRHRAAEMRACRAVAEWLAALNARLRNQPQPEIEWGD